MKLDMTLLQAILEYVEETDQGNQRVLPIPNIPGYDYHQVRYHIRMCVQAGYLRDQTNYPIELRHGTQPRQGRDDL